MKSFIPLMTAAAILMSMPQECKDKHLFYEAITAPAGVTVNGTQCRNESYARPYNYKPYTTPTLHLTEDDFEVFFMRAFECPPDNEYIQMSMSISGPRPLELNKRYPVPHSDDGAGYLNSATIEFNYTVLSVIDGWMEITQMSPGDGEFSTISGKFEFSARNKSTDETFEFTDGFFENVQFLTR